MNTQTQSQGLSFEKVWQMFQETDKKFQETDRQIKENSRKLTAFGVLHGGLSNNIGESVEEFFYYGFEKKRVIGKIRFNKIVQNMKTDKAEYDLVLTNGTYVAIIEVKHKFRPDSLEKFISKKLPVFKKEFPKFAHCKIIAGIAGFVIPKETKNTALHAGLYIFTQSGENIKILNHKNFEPMVY